VKLCSDHHSCIDEAIESADKIIYEKGLRFTDLRKQVFKLIWESHKPVKAYDLLEKIKKNDTSAKPPTIYRTLDFLLKNGLIHRLNSQNSFIGCSHPHKHEDCYFLICEKCHEISECCNNDLNLAIAKTVGLTNFTPANITLEIEGICKECAE
jgi:Fur family zinc uptake transcriptional regulator